MTLRYRWLSFAAFLGLVVASVLWIRVTPGSPLAVTLTAPALGIALLVAAAVLVRLGLALKRPMLSLGILCAVFFLTVDVVLLIPRPSLRYDPAYLESIGPGTTIQEVERLLGIPLQAGVHHRDNPERRYAILTTREIHIPPHHEWKDWSVGTEILLVQFDDHGIVLRTEKGGHTFRAETFVDGVKRRLGLT